jgi:hypothetical protein
MLAVLCAFVVIEVGYVSRYAFRLCLSWHGKQSQTTF